MRRQVLGLAFLTALLAFPTWVLGQGAAEDEKLYGTWNAFSKEVDGKKEMAPEGVFTMVLTKGGKAIMKEKGQPDEVGTWKVIANTNPKQIQVSGLKGDDGDVKAIYQVDGEFLKLGISSKGPKGDLPKSFDSKDAVILTLKKQK